MKFQELLQQKILFFDGAMGTMLQSAGLPAGEAPDVWNITHPDAVTAVHSAYLAAGCDVITTNTFGCTEHKLARTGYSAAEVAAAAVRNAKEAIRQAGGKERFVALDIGPTGKLLKPLGDLSFEEAYAMFRETIEAGAAAGADLVLIETMSDAYELKAAVLAAKECCTLPVLATVTLDRRGKLLTGGDVPSVTALLEGLRVDALGFNCGLGPREMLPFLEELSRCASIPILLQPNAGLPREANGRTVFDVGPEEFAQCMQECVRRGARLLGGCCGTTPEHIRALVAQCGSLTPPALTQKKRTVAASYAHAVYFGEGKPVLIGERINPTGKPRMKQALRDGDYDSILREGILQQERGVDALDVNAGLPELDEPAVLTTLTEQLQSVTDLPLQLDSADPEALARALRVYNGKAIINSVNGKESSMAAVFPLAARYGGVIVALTLDESGIPEDVEGRLAIARRILARGAEYGLQPHDFLFDPLTLTISAGGDNARVTLECVRRLREELGVSTSLGVSNVSFGLPARGQLNASFFTLAIGAGLSAAIMNPHAPGMLEAWRACSALLGMDAQCRDYIAAYGNSEAAPAPAQAQTLSLYDAVLRGLWQPAQEAAERDLLAKDPLAVINDSMVPALNTAGERFEAGTLFLPQLLMCAEAAKAAFSVIRTRMGEAADASRGTVVIATVQGDVHDIGKNIVKALLENYRFKVIDLGKDVPPEAVVEAAVAHKARLVGLSALMTTTVPSMRRTIAALREAAPGCCVMCGGAVLTEEYARDIGADFYVRDAMESVRRACEIYPEA